MNVDEFLKSVVSEISEEIKFAEAKNATLITLNSALIVATSAKAVDTNLSIKWKILLIGLVVCLLVPLIITIFSFKAKTKKGHITNDNFMYFYDINKNFNINGTAYYNTILSIFTEDFYLEQLSKQIVDLSFVAHRKFKCFNIAIFIEILVFAICAIFALLYIILKFIGIEINFLP